MQYLQKRGVFHAAQHMNITPARYYDDTPGFAIPVQDAQGSRIRFRAIDKTSDGHKTKWLGKSGSYTPKYYHPPEIIDAIATTTTGTLILASGEFDLLTFVEIGWLNVVSFSSENSIPKNLIETLHAWNVRHVEYWIDNDTAGAKSARRLQDMMSESGITLNAYSLAGLVPEKGDTNDLWQILKFDREKFIHALKSAPLAELPASNQPKQPPTITQFDGEFPPDFVRDVIAALMRQPNAKDKRDQILCSSPFREDNKPSFSFSKSKLAGFDFGTGEGYGIVEVGRVLGIEIRDYIKQPIALPKHTESAKQYCATFTPDLTINQRYTSEMDVSRLLKHRASIIKAGLGTGKTALASRLIAQMEQGGKFARVLIVSHRRSLVGNLAARFEAEVYEQVPVQYLSQAPRLAITVDSLHKIDPSRHYDLLIMDECEQVLRHLNGGTLKGKETTTAYERLRSLVQSAGHVLALDAHASDATAAWLRAQVDDVLKIENTYTHDWGVLEFHDKPETVIDAALAAVKAQPDQTHVVITSSRQYTELYRQIFAQVVGDDAVMMVNSWNSESADVQYFLYNINDCIRQYRVVIASPSIASGVDVTAPIAGVWGVFTARPLLPSDMMQMLMRYRNASHRAVTIQPSTSDALVTDPQTLYEAEILRYHGTTQAILGNIPPLSETLREGARLMATLTADDNLQQADIRAAFLSLATGFQVKEIIREAPAMRETLKAARQTMKDRIKAQVIAADAISKQQLDTLRQGGADITHDIRFGHERWKIEDLIGATITEQLYDDLHTRQSRAALRLFAALDAQPADLREIDRAEVDNSAWLSKRQHLTRKVQTVQGIMKRVFPSGLNDAEQLTKAQITERLGDLEQILADLRLYFHDRADYSEQAVPILRRVLATIGVKLESKQIQRDGTRLMLYWINMGHLARWQLYAIQVNRPKNTEDDPIISVNLGDFSGNTPEINIMVPDSSPDGGWMTEIVF